MRCLCVGILLVYIRMVVDMDGVLIYYFLMIGSLKILLLAFPGLENNFAPVDLPLLDHGHVPPVAYIGRIDIPARFDAESRAGASSRGSVRAGSDIQVLSGVKLERRVCREHIEVQLRRGMEEARAGL